MANCNTQQLNITCGTDVVLHDRLIFDGETFDPNLSVGIAANLVSSLGKRTALDVQVVDDELLISVPWIDGTLPGCYGLEVTGSCNSKKWATYADSLIKYTKVTRIGVSEVTVESDSYDITQEIGYRYGEGGNINDVKVNGVSVVNSGKANITIPTKVSQYKNDADYQNAQQVSKSIQDNLVPNAVVTVDDNTGTPSATVTKNGNTLNFAFKNLKGGKGDKGDDGGVGPVGPQGATGVYDPSTQDFLVTLETTTGQSQTKTMTQKAITDEIAKDRVWASKSVDLSGLTEYNTYINNDLWDSTYGASTCLFLKVVPGANYRVSREDGDGRWQVVFLQDGSHVSGEQPNYAGGVEAFPGWKTGIEYMTAPSDANYMYIRCKGAYISYLPTVELITPTRERIEKIDQLEAERIAYEEEISLDAAGVLNYYINTNNVWVSGSSSNRCARIPIVKRGTLKVVSKENIGFNLEFLNSFDGYDTGGNADLTDDVRIGTLRGTQFLEIPEGAKYIYIRLKASGTDMSPAFIGYANFANDVIISNEKRIEILESANNKADELTYKYGTITTSGYNYSVKSRKVSEEKTFTPGCEVKVFNPSPDKVKYILFYFDENGTISSTFDEYTTFSQDFIAQQSWRYVIRFRAVSADTQAALDALSVDDYPYFVYEDDSNEEDNTNDLKKYIANAYISIEKAGVTRYDCLGLLHFSDIHGDNTAAEQIKKWRDKYNAYIDDVLNTGDMVHRYADGTSSYPNASEWWRGCGLPDISLNLIGNHDGCANDGQDTPYDKAQGSWVWNAKGKEWDFDKYIADYIDGKGIIMPTGYDDPESRYYKACFWHKDYDDKHIRLIALDCMHKFDGIVNPNTGLSVPGSTGTKLENLTTEQEEWLVALLNETFDPLNSAYGYSIVVACHYPLDDFDGANAKVWSERTHDFTDFNRNADGGYVMDYKTDESTNWHFSQRYPEFALKKEFCLRNSIDTGYAEDGDNYSKGSVNNFGEIINEFINRGGKFVVWLSGHVHCNMMFYPTKYPNILVCATTMAGNQTGSNAEDRTVAKASANYVVVDTSRGYVKMVKLGHTTNLFLTPINYICYDYINKKIVNEG